MPRRREVPKRDIIPDPKYNSELAAKFMASIMKRGKKSTAEKIFYGAMDVIEQRGDESPIEVFKKAIDNVKPVVEVKSRRVGGATYQVPTEVRPNRRQALAFRWVLSFARERPGKSMAEKLANELMDAAKGEGGAMRRREETHRMAEANKAFAHYRW